MLTPVEPADASDLWNAVDTLARPPQRRLPWVPFNTDWTLRGATAKPSASDWDHARALPLHHPRARGRGAFSAWSGWSPWRTCTRARSSATGRAPTGSRRGYMTEAARATVVWAFKRLNAHRVRVAAATDNFASLGVIRRLGFRFEGIAREAERCQGALLDHSLFALLATDPLQTG